MNTVYSPASPLEPSLQADDTPREYYQLTMEEIHRRGQEVKDRLGDELLILTHHYQQDDTFFFGDVAGDSLYLAQEAAKTSAKYIIFCGVQFMAESADILTAGDQQVVLPNLNAGCSMADMADPDTIEDCWEHLEDLCGEESFIPITYINSSATLKAFCARKGGTICTSTNAKKILSWALDQRKRVIFFPDQHLGRNTGHLLGIPSEKMVLWNRALDGGGLGDQAIQNSQIVLWDGYCSVHCRFTLDHVKTIRSRIPDVKIIVHPECPHEIVEASDYSGSTNQILKTIDDAPSGTSWAVGTEINMVHRMAKQFAKDNKHVEILNPNVCICSTMYRNHPATVLWVLDQLMSGEVIHQISVPDAIKQEARLALDRMLKLSQ